MKKILSAVLLLIISTALYAQKDVTQFLGIPVDGSKSAMMQKLKTKGFTSSPADRDILVGKFNGVDVNIYIVTNGDKVYRIAIFDANPINEVDIKIRFNNLCQQFQDNTKYLPASLSSSDYILWTICQEEAVSGYLLSTICGRRYSSYAKRHADRNLIKIYGR